MKRQRFWLVALTLMVFAGMAWMLWESGLESAQAREEAIKEGKHDLSLQAYFDAIQAKNEKEMVKKPAEGKPIEVLAWLVGGTWTADASKMGNGMQRIETRYQWADNDAYLRFTTHFVLDKGTIKRYDGNMFWDPDKKELAMWYMASDGSVMQGPMMWENSVLGAKFKAPDFEGKIADLKVEVTRKTNDKYVWALFEKEGDGWKPLASLEYNRM